MTDRDALLRRARAALEDALALFSYVGVCPSDCGHRFCNEKRADRDTIVETIAAIDALGLGPA